MNDDQRISIKKLKNDKENGRSDIRYIKKVCDDFINNTQLRFMLRPPLGKNSESYNILVDIFKKHRINEDNGDVTNANDISSTSLYSCLFGKTATRIDIDSKQPEESTFLITLDANRISGVFEMSRGSADRCICDLRGLFTRVLLTTAPVAFVTAHNHPSNSNKTTPSDMDIAIVERIKEAAKVFGLNYFDNIIVGRNDYYSFRNEGLL